MSTVTVTVRGRAPKAVRYCKIVRGDVVAVKGAMVTVQLQPDATVQLDASAFHAGNVPVTVDLSALSSLAQRAATSRLNAAARDGRVVTIEMSSGRVRLEDAGERAPLAAPARW